MSDDVLRTIASWLWLEPDEADAPVSAERHAALTEAYWKLREHASALRGTKVHLLAKERHEADPEDERALRRYAWLESNCRGIEAAARDIAEMLGIPEHEIEPIEGTTPMTTIDRARMPENPRCPYCGSTAVSVIGGVRACNDCGMTGTSGAQPPTEGAKS